MAAISCSGFQAFLNSWVAFFGNLQSFLRDIHLQQASQTSHDYREYVVARLGAYCSHVYMLDVQIVTSDSALQTLHTQIGGLLTHLRALLGEWEDSLVLNHTSASTQSYQPGTVRNLCGRPYIDITEDQLHYLHNLGFSWSEVARMLGEDVAIDVQPYSIMIG